MFGNIEKRRIFVTTNQITHTKNYDYENSKKAIHKRRTSINVSIRN